MHLKEGINLCRLNGPKWELNISITMPTLKCQKPSLMKIFQFSAGKNRSVLLF